MATPRRRPGRTGARALAGGVADVDASTLGQLVALHEHKVFVLGALWDVNAFDQWGVELGKQLAGPIGRELAEGRRVHAGAHDGSTEGLLDAIRAAQGVPAPK